VADDSGLKYQAATRKPGEAVEFNFQRQGQIRTSRGKLSAPPGETQTPRVLAGRHSFDGVSIATINPALAEEQGVDPFTRGAIVTAVDGAREGARAGLRPGDIILQVNDEPIQSSQDLSDRLSGGQRGKVTIQRGDQQITAVLFL
jgi:S1-C subfamily serine protease